MKKILLTSDGFKTPKIGEKFIELFDKPAEEIKVIIITLNRKEESLKRQREDIKSYGIKELNIGQIELDRKITYADLEKYDAVYVCGGNSFHILNQARKTGFMEAVKKFVESGKVYTGVSAGSYIACPTIEQARWKHQDRNDIRLKDLTALGFVDFIVSVHYRPEVKEIVDREAAKSKYKVIKLTDQQAVLVIGNTLRIVE